MNPTIRRTALLSAVVGPLLIGFPVLRTARFGSATATVKPAPSVTIPEGAANRLAGAIRMPTISNEDPAAFDAETFQALHAYLESSFPRVHTQLKRETVAAHSLLYRWEGTRSSLKPILLMGHLDVVPVEPNSERKWQYPPFEGRIVDGFIWGRGSIDNKSTVLGTLEAVEMLLSTGFHPMRTVYLAYGHDEEVGGTHGAREIAALLEKRGIELEMVLDEGGVIGEGLLPGISAPVALVGIAEKGFASLELSTRGDGGHSSLPPAQSTIGVLSAAIARLEENPMPARLEFPTRTLFNRIGPGFPLMKRAVFANLWLTEPLVLGALEDSPTTNAMIRTTIAPTIFQAGSKDNVLPGFARAVVNFRILPGDSVASVTRHVQRVVDDTRVEVRVVGRFSAEPSDISSTASESFRTMETTIRSINPDVIVAPYLVVVVTDARHYSSLSRNVFRFLPLRLAADDLKRMHGTDERVSIRSYENAIRTYREIIVDLAGDPRES